MLELALVCALALIMMAISIIQLQPVWQQLQANAAMGQVKSVLRQARETAISQRRGVAVQFAGTNTINLYLWQVSIPAGGGNPIQTLATTPFLSVPLYSNVQFITFAGEPDTPDAFGIPAAGGIEFGGTAGVPTGGVAFRSDGTLTDVNTAPINGTVFIGLPGNPVTSRAVTILGNTGRVRAYQGTGTGWLQ